MGKTLEQEFTDHVHNMEVEKRAFLKENELNDIFGNFLLIGLFGGVGVALVVWRLSQK